ncbi:MAG: undecaprenyldiphospho-muramoylpentapeptide beta-N-acetylglucosaminyltransferase [Acidobacteria bacterium]|nr:MAG: undecaprenyldiphospho-muramoylpentapeptide beta-N-acetylglucosaminyltransferase [Acidobacteriota bacterium]
MNFAIACGGTGGHLFPGIAVAEALMGRGHEILLLISEKQIDATAVKDRSEFRVEKIPAIGLPKLFSNQVLPFAVKFMKGLNVCRRIYRSFRPRAVLGMGGFTSTAPILAGRMAGLPALIHESNAIPGKANLLNARLCHKVLIGFSECGRYFPKASLEVTGTPIRSSLRSPVDRNIALRNLGLDSEKKIVLVMGGSQGARGINGAVVAALPRLDRTRVQFIHLTGKEDEHNVSESYKSSGFRAFVSAFYHRMEEPYSVADVAIARSGAATLTELSYFNLPSILIPYPFASENHQYLNAEIFAKNSRAEVIEESRADEDTLGSLINRFLGDNGGTRSSGRHPFAVAPEIAATRIAEIIEKSCE